ncbi:MAG: hypothetical protein QME60_08420 [Verrucomicrobiota bacterium]|nr:hypothetical protein [Verrucomicrobiota bacterium]
MKIGMIARNWTMFSVELEFPVDQGNARLRVHGVYSAYGPPILSGHPDTWEPGQGMELEDLAIQRPSAYGWFEMSDRESRELRDHPDFHDSVRAAIMDGPA